MALAELKSLKILKFDEFNEEACSLKKQLADATQRELNLRSDWLEARAQIVDYEAALKKLTYNDWCKDDRMEFYIELTEKWKAK